MNKNKKTIGILMCVCVLALLGVGFLLRKKAAAPWLLERHTGSVRATGQRETTARRLPVSW